MLFQEHLLVHARTHTRKNIEKEMEEWIDIFVVVR